MTELKELKNAVKAPEETVNANRKKKNSVVLMQQANVKMPLLVFG